MVDWKEHTRNDIIKYNDKKIGTHWKKGSKLEIRCLLIQDRDSSVKSKSTGTVSEKGNVSYNPQVRISESTLEYPHLCVVKCQGTDRMNQRS